MPEDLYLAARDVFYNAHAPYSNFRVAAALRAENGQIFRGCNVENLSFGATLCAERVAICSAVTAGQKKFNEVLILTDTPEPVPPCGICRQIIAEFNASAIIYSATLEGGMDRVARYKMQELLPHALPENLLSMTDRLTEH